MSVGTKHIFFKCVLYFIKGLKALEWVFSSGLSRLADRGFSLFPMFLPLQSSELLFSDLLLCLASYSETYYKFVIQAPHQVGIVILICLMRTPGWRQILLNLLNHSYWTIRWWGWTREACLWIQGYLSKVLMICHGEPDLIMPKGLNCCWLNVTHVYYPFWNG